MRTEPIGLGITGASGAAYALRLLEQLLAAGRNVHLVVSDPGRLVLKMEADLVLPAKPATIRDRLLTRFPDLPGELSVYGKNDWLAPMASGSSAPQAMVVCPCTTGTLAGLAAGTSRNLIERAADVALKEQRKLILVIRETPFSVVHLQNMLRLGQAGAVIMPANPGFYHLPQTLDHLVDYMVSRILDHLDIPNTLIKRWAEQ